MELLFLALSEILKAVIGIQIILLMLSPFLEHTLLAEKNSGVRLMLIECGVWTAWARYLFGSQRKHGMAIDLPLLMTECVLYIISAGI